MRYKFANEQLSEICTVGIDPGTLNPLYSHSQIARDGSVITEDVEFLSTETDESWIAALLNWRVPENSKRLGEFRGGLPQ